jgi:hypothetical protein
MRIAKALDDSASQTVDQTAMAAAQAARGIVDKRNHAYTFHTDPGFSFGEGWYLAAAAALAGVEVQIEPDKAQVHQAERFLRDAGLTECLRPYEARPRANKQLPEIVAQAFRADPIGAKRTPRASFLGSAPTPQRIIDWVDRAVAKASAQQKVLLWVRRGAYHSGRNANHTELLDLAERCLAAKLVPVLIGDAPPSGEFPQAAIDLTLFWKDALFQGADMRRAQLQLFEYLKRAHALVGQLGVTTAGMDGPALMGLPTLYLTDEPNVRLGAWVGAVPGYRELVRKENYLDRASDVLREWRG